MKKIQKSNVKKITRKSSLKSSEMLIPPRTWVFQKPMQSLAQQFSTPYVKKKIDLKLYIKTTKYIFQVCST